MKPLTAEEVRAMLLTPKEQQDMYAAMRSEEYFDCKRCGHRVYIGWVVCPNCNSLVGHRPDQDYSDE